MSDFLTDEIKFLRKELSESQDYSKSLERRIDVLEQRIVFLSSHIENVEEADLDKRVQDLEKNEMKRRGIAAGIALASSGGMAAVFKYLFGG